MTYVSVQCCGKLEECRDGFLNTQFLVVRSNCAFIRSVETQLLLTPSNGWLVVVEAASIGVTQTVGFASWGHLDSIATKSRCRSCGAKHTHWFPAITRSPCCEDGSRCQTSQPCGSVRLNHEAWNAHINPHNVQLAMKTSCGTKLHPSG